MSNDEKWSYILLKSCGVNMAKFLKYVWPFSTHGTPLQSQDFGSSPEVAKLYHEYSQ